MKYYVLHVVVYPTRARKQEVSLANVARIVDDWIMEFLCLSRFREYKATYVSQDIQGRVTDRQCFLWQFVIRDPVRLLKLVTLVSVSVASATFSFTLVANFPDLQYSSIDSFRNTCSFILLNSIIDLNKANYSMFSNTIFCYMLFLPCFTNICILYWDF